MTIENNSWSISTKECCRPWRGLNPRPPGLQSDGAANWAKKILICGMGLDLLYASFHELSVTLEWKLSAINPHDRLRQCLVCVLAQSLEHHLLSQHSHSMNFLFYIIYTFLFGYNSCLANTVYCFGSQQQCYKGCVVFVDVCWIQILINSTLLFWSWSVNFNSLVSVRCFYVLLSGTTSYFT